MVKPHVIRLPVIECPNISNQIALCAFHSFLVEVQINAGYIHAMHAQKAIRRLGLQATRGARNKI